LTTSRRWGGRWDDSVGFSVGAAVTSDAAISAVIRVRKPGGAVSRPTARLTAARSAGSSNWSSSSVMLLLCTTHRKNVSRRREFRPDVTQMTAINNWRARDDSNRLFTGGYSRIIPSPRA
jgi:hypothetical protein